MSLGSDDRWAYLAKLELKDRSRLQALLADPALNPAQVAEVHDIASKVGMPVRMERIDLQSGTKTQYDLVKPGGAPIEGTQQVDVSILLDHEIAMINRILKAHGIQAEARRHLTLVAHSSFISYGLRLAPNEKIAKIEGIHRELANGLRQVRARHGYTGSVMVRVRDQPVALETPHPAPVPLDWRGAILKQAAMTALVGKRYYNGSAAETVSLPTNHHMLVAAMSGGGKSTLVRMALSTLCLNTSPADLSVLLVDLKNDDLVPFKALPHCIGYAGNLRKAADAISQLTQIRDERIEGAEKTPRILLVVDELAELSDDKEALAQLGRILSTGRSLGINVWAGTQYPTASAIVRIGASVLEAIWVVLSATPISGSSPPRWKYELKRGVRDAATGAVTADANGEEVWAYNDFEDPAAWGHGQSLTPGGGATLTPAPVAGPVEATWTGLYDAGDNRPIYRFDVACPVTNTCGEGGG